MMIWAWFVCKFCSGFHLVPSFNGFLLSSFDLLCGFLLLLIFASPVWSFRWNFCSDCAIAVRPYKPAILPVYVHAIFFNVLLDWKELSCSWFLP